MLPPEVERSLITSDHYVTGFSALSLSYQGGFSPLSDSHGLVDPRLWQIAGIHIDGAVSLLGLEGIWDASGLLGVYVNADVSIMAARHERALFDLLFHFCHLRARPLPNIQSSDIDDVVDLELVSKWIAEFAVYLRPSGVQLMNQWLEY